MSKVNAQLATDTEMQSGTAINTGKSITIYVDASTKALKMIGADGVVLTAKADAQTHVVSFSA